MSSTIAPLLFPDILKSPGLHAGLAKAHGLNSKDFSWLAHVQLSTHALRSEQTPPMRAERILLNADKQLPVPLAGSFVLGTGPDDHGVFLYTPYDGLKKYSDEQALTQALQTRLETADEEDDLLAFLTVSMRKELVEKRGMTMTRETITGDVFEDQSSAINASLSACANDMLDELKRLPSLSSLLQTILDAQLETHFGDLQQSATRVSFYPTTAQTAGEVRQPTQSLSLSEALLLHFRRQGWPRGQTVEFSHPARSAAADDQSAWSTAIKSASGKLTILLFRQLETYWNAASFESSPRRTFFSRTLQDQARADLMIKRETGILSAGEFDALHALIREPAVAVRRPTFETVCVSEEAAYVELAGSLMINHDKAYLYTPSQGTQVLTNYVDLKQTLTAKLTAAGHEDELYGLMSLEERNRFLGFTNAQVSGENIAGEIMTTLFEAIITKQRQNVEFALQCFRQSERATDIHALFDKALDIRSMIHERLLKTGVHARWSTRPLFSISPPSSRVQADKATQLARSLNADLESLASNFAQQPTALDTDQRAFLESIRWKLAKAFEDGLRGEAQMRSLNDASPGIERKIVDTVLDARRATRNDRQSINGFRPDAWSLSLTCSGQSGALPLAYCLLMTERGGMDDAHSGHCVLWTPANGLESFDDIVNARKQLQRRLDDNNQSHTLLENLSPVQRRLDQQYTLGTFQLIENSVARDRMQSAIEHYLAECEQLRACIKDEEQLANMLGHMKSRVIDTNLSRAIKLAQAVSTHLDYPDWLRLAPMAEQRTQLALLDETRRAFIDGKDFLDGVPALATHVEQTLKTLLDARFPGNGLKPQDILITPNLTLAGPACDLLEFALHHYNVAQGTGFKVASKTLTALPEKLDQAAVRQLLQSLEVATTYTSKVTEALTADNDAARARKQRFLLQLPWQLVQHAHALKLQQQLSDTGYDYVCQVLDMPDGVARAMVEGADAIASPLLLIKTAHASPVEALGLYVFGPGAGKTGPRVLYAPYSRFVFREFENQDQLIDALNTPGQFQDLVIRRLPAPQQAIFKNLLKTTIGKSSEIALQDSAIHGNALERFHKDTLSLLPRLLESQPQINAQSDWEAAKLLFSHGVRLVPHLLPGKLASLLFLWKSFRDFKDSAEDLQDHHWASALKSFIAGALSMLSLGRLAWDPEPEAATSEFAAEPESTASTATETQADTPARAAPRWSKVPPTTCSRANLQRFETATALEDLKLESNKLVYADASKLHKYAAIAGKVYPVVQSDKVWFVRKPDGGEGPALEQKNSRLVFARPGHAVRRCRSKRGKMQQEEVERSRSILMYIQAQGMTQIHRRYPARAFVIQQAVGRARTYALNCLHNFVVHRDNLGGTRVETVLRQFFEVPQVTPFLLRKIEKVILPICRELTDPEDDLLYTERFFAGLNAYYDDDTVAFVFKEDKRRIVHLTEHFFNPGMDAYTPVLPARFNVDSHARAVTLIHELSHLICDSEDLASVEARAPYTQLIDTTSSDGRLLKADLERLRKSLSRSTTPSRLFSEKRPDGARVDLDQSPLQINEYKKILKLTKTTTLADARKAFRDPLATEPRIEVILANADSIALLISELGQVLDPPPAPIPLPAPETSGTSSVPSSS
ncbi:dermonecrotic toxin domain-containing protein [Pseudomonas triticicola]|uniref:dermonecrotic toxin domain-containing protein n=1 Tax=Pseudomonas triticicola TaxID=2842345 RepID=UPI003EBEC601